MNDDVDMVQPGFEEAVIGLVLENVRHEAARIRDHSVARDDGVAFDAKVFGHERLIPGEFDRRHGSRRHSDGRKLLRAAANVYAPDASSVCMTAAGEMRNRPA